jgi:hypothetical protein
LFLQATNKKASSSLLDRNTDGKPAALEDHPIFLPRKSRISAAISTQSPSSAKWPVSRR